MKYIATIEIPKNSDRRIHKGNQPENMGKFVDFGPIAEKITANGGRMPLAYGFIEGTHNPGENDEIDVMVFSEKEFKTEDSIEVVPFAMMVRSDGDQKILAHDDTIQLDSWDDVPADTQKILLEFNGFKLPITSVENKEATIQYIQQNKK